VLVPLIVTLSSLTSGLTVSILFASSITFGLASNWLICSSFEPDLIIIPVVAVSVGMTPIPMDVGHFFEGW
jgi:hypothetical protein